MSSRALIRVVSLENFEDFNLAVRFSIVCKPEPIARVG